MKESDLGAPPKYNTMEPYSGRSTNYSELGSMDLDDIAPGFTLTDIPPRGPYQTYLTDVPPVPPPDHLAAAASSPTLFSYQSDPLTQATGYTTNSAGSYFYPYPNYPQPSARQRQRPSGGPHGPEPDHALGTGDDPALGIDDIGFLPPLPYQPTHRSEHPDTEADSARPGPHVCSCGAAFGRRTDLERHQRTSKEHSRGSRGPACPISGCRYPARFTRVDNFKAHYVNQHGMSHDEANSYIRDWISRGRL